MAETIPTQLTDILAAVKSIAPTNEQASLDALAASLKALSDGQAQLAAQVAAIAAVLGVDGSGAATNGDNPEPPLPPQPTASLFIDGGQAATTTGTVATVATPL